MKKHITGYFPKPTFARHYTVWSGDEWNPERHGTVYVGNHGGCSPSIVGAILHVYWRDGDYLIEGSVEKVTTKRWTLNISDMNRHGPVDREFTGNGQWTAILDAIEYAYKSPVKPDPYRFGMYPPPSTVEVLFDKVASLFRRRKK